MGAGMVNWRLGLDISNCLSYVRISLYILIRGYNCTFWLDIQPDLDRKHGINSSTEANLGLYHYIDKHRHRAFHRI